MGCRLALAALVAMTATASARPRWQELPMPPPMPDPASHGDVESNGALIYYATYGKGAPVILLHGGLGNSDHWSNQVPALAEKFQVIVIDSRGQGRSTRGKGALTYDAMAKDVLAVMDQLKLERASIVGWSDGGEIALKLGIGSPDRVDKLFVFGANYDANGSKHATNRSPTFGWYTTKCRRDYARLSKTPRAFDALVDYMLPLWRNPMGFTKDQLRSIQAPTLIGDGDHDEVIVRDQVEEMSRLIPHAKLAIIPDASHFALWQAPTEFTKTLLDFLSES